jgi:hypothetical protein
MGIIESEIASGAQRCVEAEKMRIGGGVAEKLRENRGSRRIKTKERRNRRELRRSDWIGLDTSQTGRQFLT